QNHALISYKRLSVLYLL
ncbi:hypothetical protein D047_2224B, partial [Vibrio parahaemolyticus VPTS-2010_2]